MEEIKFDKLNLIEHLIAESFGKANSKEVLLDLPETQALLNFFKISFEELVILAILVDGGTRQEEFGINAFIEHFGGGLSSLKNINDALHGLIEKGFVISNTKNRLSKTLVKQTFQADEKVYEALLSNKSERLESKPADNFNELLKYIEEHLERRFEGCFDAETLKKLIEKELNTAKKCAELEWFCNYSDLSLSEKILFFCAAIKYSKNEQQIDLEYTIKQIEDNFSKQKEFRDSIANSTSPLIKNDLLIREEDGFIFDEFVGLTKKSIDALFEKEKKTIKKSVFSTATILNPVEIVDEKLYYNENELKQIKTIEKVLSKEKHQLVVNQLEENGLGKGISILFNGYSGTGKTATAKRLAKITNRGMFCVDVEKIVDKWMGNSEKNVKKIFDEYYEFSKECELMPILFFNEDSIFSRRVEVGHSSDRAHNSMQNLLLEQMENFTGIAIVTSNNSDKLDKAFERRFLYKVEFEKPTKETQLQLLQNSFPSLTNNVIQKAIENYSFTGGQIYNIRKKYIMQCLLEEADLETLFLNICQEEIKVSENKKIGFTKN